jgi:hypothetical protein
MTLAFLRCWIFCRMQQVRRLRPHAHVQPLRDPRQRHRRLLPQPPGDAHLARIAFAPLRQNSIGNVLERGISVETSGGLSVWFAAAFLICAD